jgi:hypothetical protein
VKTTRWAPVLVCLLGTTALAQPDGLGAAAAPSELVPVASDPPGSPRTLQRLTPRQKRQARRIVARDPRFKTVVAPHPYRYAVIIPWGTLDKRPRVHREVFIGTYMEAELDTPKPSVVATFSGITYPPSRRPDYRIRTLELTVRGLHSLALHVDLKRRKLAGISIGGADEVIPPPGYQPPAPNPD